MSFYWLVLGCLGTWRITHLLQAEDGPGRLLARFRRVLGSGFLGSLVDCFYCLSVWVALPFALELAVGMRERLLCWPALSAGAILLERITEHAQPGALYYEDKEEDSHGMLRQSEGTLGSVDRLDAPEK